MAKMVTLRLCTHNTIFLNNSFLKIKEEEVFQAVKVGEKSLERRNSLYKSSEVWKHPYM